VNDQRFHGLRTLGRPVLKFTVMAQNDVTQFQSRLWRKIGNRLNFFVDHFYSHDQVADHPAFIAVFNQTVIREFVNLADIMEHAAGDQQVPVEVGIMLSCPVE